MARMWQLQCSIYMLYLHVGAECESFSASSACLVCNVCICRLMDGVTMSTHSSDSVHGILLPSMCEWDDMASRAIFFSLPLFRRQNSSSVNASETVVCACVCALGSSYTHTHTHEPKSCSKFNMFCLHREMTRYKLPFVCYLTSLRLLCIRGKVIVGMI